MLAFWILAQAPVIELLKVRRERVACPTPWAAMVPIRPLALVKARVAELIVTDSDRVPAISLVPYLTLADLLVVRLNDLRDILKGAVIGFSATEQTSERDDQKGGGLHGLQGEGVTRHTPPDLLERSTRADLRKENRINE